MRLTPRLRRPLALALLALAASTALYAQALPTPAQFVRFLDMRCYRIENQPPINRMLRLDHLNPVLTAMGLPPEFVTLREPQDLCVPVQKDDLVPPAGVLPFLRFLDWKCYGIDGPPLNIDLTLTQLNPVTANLFGNEVKVTVREPQQLCVPVTKNNVNPPNAVRQLIQWLDVKCYRVESDQIPDGEVRLTHLNPVLVNGVAEPVKFLGPPSPNLLCVPVAKNQVLPPAGQIRQIVSFSDVLCYDIEGPNLDRKLDLRHLNPVLIQQQWPAELQVPVTTSHRLCVPVAKNNVFPPG